jgi:MoxR-like ATPase
VDEVNRASPKTQSGLLECMQERHVTVDVHSHELARPFLVFATQNPVEYEGTYPLPEAQVDRFMVRLSMGYPSRGRGGMLAGHEAGDRVLELEPVADV